ncbi:unnamed protein product [Victoria cruziana]
MGKGTQASPMVGGRGCNSYFHNSTYQVQLPSRAFHTKSMAREPHAELIFDLIGRLRCGRPSSSLIDPAGSIA